MLPLKTRLRRAILLFLREKILYKIPVLKCDKRTVLFIRFDGIGDYLLLRNFLPYLRNSNRFKDKRLIFIGEKSLKDIVLAFDVAYFDDFLWFSSTKFAYSNDCYKMKIINQIRKFRAAQIIHSMHTRDHFSEKLTHLSGAKYKIASDGDETILGIDWKKRSDNLYDENIPTLTENHFEFERNRVFFENLLQIPILIHKPFFENIKITRKQNLVSLFPSASMAFRRWSPTRFAALIKLIHQGFPHLIFRILGKASDKAIALQIIEMTADPSIIFENLCGQTTLLTLIDCIAESRILISNDSSGVHFAAMLDVPTVCISNGNHFGRYHPYPSGMTDKIEYVYPDDTFYDKKNFEELSAKYCRWQDSMKLTDINNISEKRVFEFVKFLLHKF